MFLGPGPIELAEGKQELGKEGPLRSVSSVH